MRTQLALVAVCVVIVAISATGDGFSGEFRDCKAKAREWTAGSDSCGGSGSGLGSGEGSGEGSGSGCGSGEASGEGSGDCGLGSNETSDATAEPTVVSSTLPSEPPSSSPFSGSSKAAGLCPCKLVEFLHQLCNKLTGAQYDLFLQFIIDIQVQILCDGNHSEDEKFFTCVGMLQLFFEVNVEIKAQLEFIKIDGFGRACDLAVAANELQIELEVTKNLLVVVDGKCPLQDIFENATTIDEECRSVIQAKLDIFISLVASGSYSFEELCILFYKEFSVVFVEHPEWKIAVEAIDIPGFGFFGQFLETCKYYVGIFTFPITFDGPVETCPILEAINAVVSNTSIDIGVRLQIKEFYENLKANFTENPDPVARMNYFYEYCYSVRTMQDFNLHVFLGIELTLEYSGMELKFTLQEILYEIFMLLEYDFNCNLPLFPVSTTPEITTAESTTPEVTTTIAPSTAAPSSPYLNCSYCGSVFQKVDSSFVISLKQTISTWTTACQNTVAVHVTRIDNFIKGAATPEAAAQSVYNYLASGPFGNSSCGVDFMKITITITGGATWGSVCEYKKCVTLASTAKIQC